MTDTPYDPRQWDHQWTPIDNPNPNYVSEEWAVEGWNDSGGGSMLRGPWGKTLKGAIQRAEQLQIRGDVDGRKYEHVSVVKFRWRTCANSEHFTLDEARAMR